MTAGNHRKQYKVTEDIASLYYEEEKESIQKALEKKRRKINKK